MILMSFLLPWTRPPCPSKSHSLMIGWSGLPVCHRIVEWRAAREPQDVVDRALATVTNEVGGDADHGLALNHLWPGAGGRITAANSARTPIIARRDNRTRPASAPNAKDRSEAPKHDEQDPGELLWVVRAENIGVRARKKEQEPGRQRGADQECDESGKDRQRACCGESRVRSARSATRTMGTGHHRFGKPRNPEPDAVRESACDRSVGIVATPTNASAAANTTRGRRAAIREGRETLRSVERRSRCRARRSEVPGASRPRASGSTGREAWSLRRGGCVRIRGSRATLRTASAAARSR